MRVLLQDRLPKAIEPQADSEQAHSRFAGDRLQPVASALQGVDELVALGTPPLKASLAPGDKTQSWNEAWAPIEQWIENTDHLTPEALTQALQQLGESLNPEMGLTSPASDES